MSAFSSAQLSGEPISFARGFSHSARFRELFTSGMALVNDAALYLDGDGRAAARALEHPMSVTYSTESMRLTTRLMQVASWLIQRRAVVDGRMTEAEAAIDTRTVRLSPSSTLVRSTRFDALPTDFKALVEASCRLHDRVYRLDLMLRGEPPVLPWSGLAAGGNETASLSEFRAKRAVA